MLNIHRVLGRDRLLRGLTGLNRKAFDELLATFATVYEQTLTTPASPRQRALGGGRKARLKTIQAKQFFILFYFKCYPTFDLAGVLFDLDRSQANRWLHRLQPIIEAALGKKMALPERKLASVEEFIEHFPEVNEVMIDGTERPIQRPQDPKQQRLNYSGKKKRHTRKHLAVVEQNKRVIVLSCSREGKVHDKGLLNEAAIVENIPDEIAIEVDLGFQGLQNEYVNIEIPHKKPKGGELTQQQKQENRELSAKRVRCENAFAGIKRYNAVQAIYRNRVRDFDDRLMITATGLWNFYLMAA